MGHEEIEVGNVIDLNIGEVSTVRATVISMESVELFPNMSDVILEINGREIEITCHDGKRLNWFGTHEALLEKIGFNK